MVNKKSMATALKKIIMSEKEFKVNGHTAILETSPFTYILKYYYCVVHYVHFVSVLRERAGVYR